MEPEDSCRGKDGIITGAIRPILTCFLEYPTLKFQLELLQIVPWGVAHQIRECTAISETVNVVIVRRSVNPYCASKTKRLAIF